MNRRGIKDSPLCPLFDNTKETGPEHIQRCQSLTDAMDIDNNSNMVKMISYTGLDNFLQIFPIPHFSQMWYMITGHVLMSIYGHTCTRLHYGSKQLEIITASQLSMCTRLKFKDLSYSTSTVTKQGVLTKKWEQVHEKFFTKNLVSQTQRNAACYRKFSPFWHIPQHSMYLFHLWGNITVLVIPAACISGSPCVTEGQTH